ncbi:MAG: squalene synthase HpnC [Planctomycetaceae bacterium]|nr:squalene synthase HpnC [Planctomycetaceae bacterium]
MSAGTFATELARFGPASRRRDVSLSEAKAYCRELARSHYENFSVISWLLPKHLRQHFCNVYAYCRWADDLADEVGSDAESLELLLWWREQLAGCYEGRTYHPVFIALAGTIEEFRIPQGPFAALLDAFKRDQRQTRYATFDELLDYCRCSANPVGHLVLYLGRCYEDESARLSDSICTGLQLANFLQDIANDYERGRIYLPQTTWDKFGYDEGCFAERVCDQRWRAMMQDECTRASELLGAGWPLVDCVSRDLRFQVELFVRGGLAILKEIERAEYDVWTRRPTVGKLTKANLVASTWLSKWLGVRTRKQNHG